MVTREQYRQYLEQLQPLILQKIEDNVERFIEDLLSDNVTEAFEFWLGPTGCIARCEFDRRMVDYEVVPIDLLVEWLMEIQSE